MGFLLGRLFAVVAVLAGAAGCGQRDAAVIGFAFGEEHPGVLDVVHHEFIGRPAEREPRVVTATGLIGTGGAPGQITIASRFAATPGLIGVVGHGDSRGSLAAAPVYQEAHIPLLVPTGTSRRLRTVSPWVFMMAPDDSAEAEFIAAFAVGTLRTRTAAVFYDNDEYGIGLRDALRGALGTRGVQAIVEEPIALPCGVPETAEGSILRATPRARPPDLIVIAGRTGDAACIARRVTTRVAAIRVICADGVEPDSAFYDLLGNAPGRRYVVAFWYPGAPGAASARFARSFEQLVGRPAHASQALVFDGLLLLAQAARVAGTRRDAVRRYLTELGVTRPAYDGVTGAVTFGSAARRPLYMLRIGTRSEPLVVVQ
ncbi:MAG TPA: ABC transporter substrate-binding protein [Gemmatimonadales bacterium]|nr:ABC transporter substrate-binding protein [Gemmatimonadales bacterium]